MIGAAASPGLQTPASRVQAAASGSAETPAHRKLVKAAQEFEGILISQLLGDFKGGLSAPGEESSLAASDSLNSLAIQSLSEALARRGGLGIGRLLIHQLEPAVTQRKPLEAGPKN